MGGVEGARSFSWRQNNYRKISTLSKRIRAKAQPYHDFPNLGLDQAVADVNENRFTWLSLYLVPKRMKEYNSARSCHHRFENTRCCADSRLTIV